MKRGFLLIVLIVCFTVVGFSDDVKNKFKSDIWFSMGPSFGNYFMNETNIESTYTASAGFDLSFYAFFGDRNIGLFFNCGILFPAALNYGILFPTVTNAWKNIDPSAQLDFIPLGICFGFNANEALKLYFGIGPNMNILILHTSENFNDIGDYFFCMGIGGDIGFKYKVTRFFSINFGTTVSYNFTGYREIRKFTDNRYHKYETLYSGWENGYSMIGIKPYILFGVNLTR